MTFAEKILAFYKALNISSTLPEGVEAMNPYQDETAFALCEQFYRKFYSDTDQRTVILGINPGRFGGGITGIPFTDPIKLESRCGIANDMKKKAELSADFIYKVIDGYGGLSQFYRHYYFNSLSPLGFVKEGKNLNYYDIRTLADAVEPFIVTSIQKQLSFGINRKICFCLGEGENFRYLKKLNEEYRFFEDIVPLAHPRFIMQYKRKHLQTYIDDYIRKLSQ